VLSGECLVTLVERGGQCILPRGSTVLAAKDRIYLLAKEDVLDEGFRLAGRVEKPIRKIGIVGGGRIGALIADGLLHGEKRNSEERGAPGKKSGKNLFSFMKTLIPKKFRNVVIIEKDSGVCKELSGRFPEALIMNEDLSDENFISEEQIIDSLDLVVTATDHQELNIITAVYLKSRGVGRAISMVSGGGYAAIARQLGVDVVIPMKFVVVDSILARLIGGGVRGLHRLGNGSVGILDIEIGAASQAKEKALKDFRLPEDALVMLVNRPGSEEGFIPRGDYVYTAGDRLLLIVRDGTEMAVKKIFDEEARQNEKPGEKQ
jgi:trk system potassium uptake protein TrkA